MNIHPSFTNLRSHLSHQFFTLRTTALRHSLWAKLLGKDTRLAIFPEEAPEKTPNRRFLGIQEIYIDAIVGTLNRGNDFDRHFRPLNKSLRERWINAYLTIERDGWSPILVHKVGDYYFVEDGHHRVSIAQALGLAFIPAKVWEYPASAGRTKNCPTEPCPERSMPRVYAGITN